MTVSTSSALNQRIKPNS